MTASEKILQKALVGSNLDSRQWNSIQAGLRDRAFFSSQVASARILHAAREIVAERVGGNMSASEFRREMRKVLAADGYDAGENRGTIKDLMTKARLDVIQKTNIEQARGYIHHLEATAPGAIAAFPAQELVRVRQRKKPRDWFARWKDAGGRLYEGRMVALVDDPIWTRISDFGNPFPPYAWGSGMGVRAVKKSEAIRLGVVSAEQVKAKVEELKKKPAPDFNGKMEVQDPDGNLYGELRKKFGDQVRNVDGKVVWRQEVLRKTLFTDNFKIALGEPNEKGLISKLSAQRPLAEFAKELRGKNLTIDQTWRDAKRPDGTTHISHFYPDAKHPDNIPLTVDDVEVLPSIWRNPDRVRKLQKDIFESEIDALDGSILTIQIWVNKTKGGVVPKLWTFYKKKSSSLSPPAGG